MNRYNIVRVDKHGGEIEPYSLTQAAQRVHYHDSERSFKQILASLRRGEVNETPSAWYRPAEGT